MGNFVYTAEAQLRGKITEKMKTRARGLIVSASRPLRRMVLVPPSYTYTRAVGRSENSVGQVVMWWA